MSQVLKYGGTKCCEFFLATFATLSAFICSFYLFRDDKYPRLLKVSFLATFDNRNFYYSRFFPFWFKKSYRLLIFLDIFWQNRHEIKKNRWMIRDIRDIKYPRLLNFSNFVTFSILFHSPSTSKVGPPGWTFSTCNFWNHFSSQHSIPATFGTEITRFKSRYWRH